MAVNGAHSLADQARDGEEVRNLIVNPRCATLATRSGGAGGGDEAAVGDGGDEAGRGEADLSEDRVQLGGRVAAAFGAVHQHHRVGGEGQRAALVRVEVRIVDQEQTARYRTGRGCSAGSSSDSVPV
jgi:hypothetical protein